MISANRTFMAAITSSNIPWLGAGSTVGVGVFPAILLFDSSVEVELVGEVTFGDFGWSSRDLMEKGFTGGSIRGLAVLLDENNARGIRVGCFPDFFRVPSGSWFSPADFSSVFLSNYRWFVDRSSQIGIDSKEG
jgi:hypothetical protein